MADKLGEMAHGLYGRLRWRDAVAALFGLVVCGTAWLGAAVGKEWVAPLGFSVPLIVGLLWVRFVDADRAAGDEQERERVQRSKDLAELDDRCRALTEARDASESSESHRFKLELDVVQLRSELESQSAAKNSLESALQRVQQDLTRTEGDLNVLRSQHVKLRTDNEKASIELASYRDLELAVAALHVEPIAIATTKGYSSTCSLALLYSNRGRRRLNVQIRQVRVLIGVYDYITDVVGSASCERPVGDEHRITFAVQNSLELRQALLERSNAGAQVRVRVLNQVSVDGQPPQVRPTEVDFPVLFR